MVCLIVFNAVRWHHSFISQLKKNKKTNQKHCIESEICLLNLIKIVDDGKQITGGGIFKRFLKRVIMVKRVQYLL